MKKVMLVVVIIIGISVLGLSWLYWRRHTVKMNVVGFKEHDSEYTNVVGLKEHDSIYIIKLGDVMQYSHSIHPSVGFDYSMEYDEKAFNLSYDIKYDDRYDPDKEGSDSANQTCTLKSLKKGFFKVKVIHLYRGKTERIITYKIIVK